MLQFIYRIQPRRADMLAGGPTESEAAIIGQHFQYLERLAAEGIVFTAGRTMITDDRAFGIVIFQAASEAEAVRIMENDPAVLLGVMKAELFPFRVALWTSVNPLAE